MFFTAQSYAQVNEKENNFTDNSQYDFHIKKKKSNNLAGWIVLGSGAVMIVAGLGINTSGGIIDNDTTNNNKGLWLSYLGGATTLVSIPLFLSGGKHKRKANALLKNSNIAFGNINYTSLSLTFNF